MNNGQANAVNVLARAMSGTPDWSGALPTAEQQQSALDLLLAGAYKQLSAGLQPGHAVVHALAVPKLAIRGACPMGCGETLVRTRPDGAVICDSPSCPRPSSAHEILADEETEHVVILRAHDFTLRHPLRERLDDALLNCDAHIQLSAAAGPPQPPGTYRLSSDGDLWSWEAIA